MKIGILSDTHDNLVSIKKAVNLFNREKTDLVLHAGDIVSPFTALEFQKLNCTFTGVFGNNDGDMLYLREKFEKIGQLFPAPYIANINHRQIIMMHKEKLIDALIESQKYEIIIYGHIHRLDLRKIGRSLIINPGECGGWLTNQCTVAILQTDNLEAKIIDLDDEKIVMSI